jgi:hypothetical protein
MTNYLLPSLLMPINSWPIMGARYYQPLVSIRVTGKNLSQTFSDVLVDIIGGGDIVGNDGQTKALVSVREARAWLRVESG